MPLEHLKYLDLWCNVLQGNWASNSSLAMKSPITLLSVPVSNSSRLIDCNEYPQVINISRNPRNPILPIVFHLPEATAVFTHCFYQISATVGFPLQMCLPVTEAVAFLYKRETTVLCEPHVFELHSSGPEIRQVLVLEHMVNHPGRKPSGIGSLLSKALGNVLMTP